MIHLLRKILRGLSRVTYFIRGYRHYFRFPYNPANPLPRNAIDTLSAVLELFHGSEIKLFVRDGTLLGLYRDGALISHDTDLDVGVLGTEHSRKVRETLEAQGWVVGQLVSLYGNVFHLSFFDDNNCTLDFHFFERFPEGYFCFAETDSYFFYPPELMEGVRYQLVGGRNIPTVGRIEEVLEYTYGEDWSTPQKQKNPWRSELYGVARLIERNVFHAEAAARAGAALGSKGLA